ncbi:14442_t:CDS:2 [Gigaspora margarita]|uniref:14442_t:CDS:1 n=1 Tax=Gigaspora margarita TaxID=4874 RepID=A0ABN7VHF4_GIGMA|nr:14442_t:CDS:2 [Gigaspora margarita]
MLDDLVSPQEPSNVFPDQSSEQIDSLYNQRTYEGMANAPSSQYPIVLIPSVNVQAVRDFGLCEALKDSAFFEEFFDLKSHSNMSDETKKAKLTLSTVNLKDASILETDLSAARSQSKSMTRKIIEESTEYEKIPADKLFNKLSM